MLNPKDHPEYFSDGFKAVWQYTSKYIVNLLGHTAWAYKDTMLKHPSYDKVRNEYGDVIYAHILFVRAIFASYTRYFLLQDYVHQSLYAYLDIKDYANALMVIRLFASEVDVIPLIEHYILIKHHIYTPGSEMLYVDGDIFKNHLLLKSQNSGYASDMVNLVSNFISEHNI